MRPTPLATTSMMGTVISTDRPTTSVPPGPGVGGLVRASVAHL